MTAPTVRHRDVGDKYATGVPKIKKIRGRENIAVGTWNVRTLRPAGKLEQLTHAMSSLTTRKPQQRTKHSKLGRKNSHDFSGNRTRAAGSIIQFSTTEPKSLLPDADVRELI